MWDQFILCVWQLNNRLFEELAMDVYDEVDRRENDAGRPRLFPASVKYKYLPVLWRFSIHGK